ncbi:MAG TPA: DnaJ domain-containing protein [Leptolyngbyaceae cyanobacterium M65_K2018_010]|nr:DnaJ domain-containing protein [Leptolyngbyaceae cyanobacterium M65_K2018_010]
MALAHYYRMLGLRAGASFSDIKLAYRHLARLYHPDVNPGNQRAKEKFIQVTQAYQALVDGLPPSVTQVKVTPPSTSPGTAVQPEATPEDQGQPQSPGQTQANTIAAKSKTTPRINHPPGGSAADQDLKRTSFQQLQQLFRHQRFARAVALVEGLAHRFPNDPEIRQWHAITYYRWGHDLLQLGNLQKAEACLKKAWRVDPHNRSLGQLIQQDFQRLEQIQARPLVQAQ